MILLSRAVRASKSAIALTLIATLAACSGGGAAGADGGGQAERAASFLPDARSEDPDAELPAGRQTTTG